MLCPQCRSEQCYRSKRRSAKDYALGLMRLRPWRCHFCNRRFYAWSAPLRFQFMAHCRRCGNFDLQRVSGKYVDGWSAGLIRRLGVPAYRCAPCRYRFFSILSYTRLRSIESEMGPSVESHAASG